MNTLWPLIEQLSASDKKDLVGKTLKAVEEIGELTKVILPYGNQCSTTHRFVTRDKIIEEISDTLLCLYSIAADLGSNPDELEDMMLFKSQKWARLQNYQKSFPYEIHVTVNHCDSTAFIKTCKELEVKPIVLDLYLDKEFDFQTSSVHIGCNRSVEEEAQRIKSGLINNGFKVNRIKIETVPWHPSAPTNENQLPMPRDCYFETHFNILINGMEESQLNALTTTCRQNDLHLSQNVLKKGELLTLMATYRSYDSTYENFLLKIKDLELSLQPYTLLKTVVEFSIMDTNVKHDEEWI